MVIRSMEEKDLKEVSQLYDSLMGQKNNVENMAAKFAVMSKSSDYILLVAEEDGKVVGTVMGIVCPTMVLNFNFFLVIEALIVDEEYRGKGIARSMLLELENRAVEIGCGYIILVSGKQRTEAHKLYEALGYAEEGAKGFRKILLN